MKHSGAFSHPHKDPNNRDRSSCDGELTLRREGFWDDVSWTLATCEKCKDVIALVGGGIHRWNYTVTNPAILSELSTPEQAELDTAEAIAIANLPEDVKELILSYKLANDCLTLANESQRAEIESLRLEVKRLRSETKAPADYKDWL